MTQESFATKARQLLSQGKNIVIINDTDDPAYESGWADYLMKHYPYSNLGSGFRVNLTHKKQESGEEKAT